MKKALALIFAIILVMAVATVAVFAETDAAGNGFMENGGEVETDGDVYAVFTFGTAERVSGSVGGDFLGVAGDMRLKDITIGGSLRAAAMDIKLENVSLRNITVVAQTLEIDEECNVSGIYAVAGEAKIFCKVKSLALSSNTVYIFDQIDEASITAENVYIKSGLDVSKMKISSVNEPQIFDDIPANAYSYKKSAYADVLDYTKVENGFDLSAVFTYILMNIACVWVVILISRKRPGAFGDALSKHTGAVVGFGALLLFLLPVAALFIAITVIGAFIGIAAMLVYIVVMIFATAIVSLALAEVLPTKMNRYVKAMLFCAVLTILEYAPMIGSFIGFAVSIVGFGIAFRALTGKKSPEMPAAPEATEDGAYKV